MSANKTKILRTIGQLQKGVEEGIGYIAALFLLNFFPVLWFNLYMYGADELIPLFLYALFLLTMTGLYVAVILSLPDKIKHIVLIASVIVSVVISGVELFSIYHFKTLIGTDIMTAVMEATPEETAEFLTVYVGWMGLLLMVLALALLWRGRRLIYATKLTLFHRHRRSRLILVVAIAGIIAGVLLFMSYRSFIINY